MAAWLERTISSVDGQSSIELAIMAPFLLLVTVGAIDIGRYMYGGIHVASAAHAGVQYGAQSDATAGDTAGITAAAKADALQITPLTVSPPITYCTFDSNQTAHVSCTATPPSNDRLDLFLQVTASYTFTPLIRYPGLPRVTISRTAIEQVVI